MPDYDLNAGRFKADHPDYCLRAGFEGFGFEAQNATRTAVPSASATQHSRWTS